MDESARPKHRALRLCEKIDSLCANLMHRDAEERDELRDAELFGGVLKALDRRKLEPRVAAKRPDCLKRAVRADGVSALHEKGR